MNPGLLIYVLLIISIADNLVSANTQPWYNLSSA